MEYLEKLEKKIDILYSKINSLQQTIDNRLSVIEDDFYVDDYFEQMPHDGKKKILKTNATPFCKWIYVGRGTEPCLCTHYTTKENYAKNYDEIKSEEEIIKEKENSI